MWLKVLLIAFIYIGFLMVIISSIAGPDWSCDIAFVAYANNCKEIFVKQANMDLLPLIIKSYKTKTWIIFTLFHCMNYPMLVLFFWFMSVEVELEGYNKFYYVPIFVIFLSSYILFYWRIKKTFIKFDKVGFYENDKAVENFKLYKAEINKKTGISEFKLYKNDKLAARNQPFQFNQWRYKGKIKRLKKKQYDEDKYNLKLLHLYIKYLKTYAYFFKRMHVSLWDFIDNYSVTIDNQKYESLEPLKELLIENFFVYSKND